MAGAEGTVFWRRSLGRAGVEIRPGEGRLAALLFTLFFLLITFQYVARTVRQSTFVDALGATRLPLAYLLVAACGWPFLALYVRYADRIPRHRMITGTCWGVATGLCAFWWLYGSPQPWVAAAFYVFASVAFVTTVSQFWSFAGHLLDPRQARRLFGLVGAGGLLGGIAGGQAARLAAALGSPRAALLLAAAILGIAALVTAALQRRQPGTEATAHATGRAAAGAAASAPSAAGRSGLALLFGSAHLRATSLALLLGVAVGQIIDLQFNWAVEQATTGLGERAAWFGNFFSVAGVAAFLFQILFTARIHRTAGVGAALRALPITLGLGTVALLVAAAVAPEMVVGAALALKIGDTGLRHSLDQSTRELLFVPLPPTVRAKAKAFIDMFVQRAGETIAALLLLPVTFGLMTVPQSGWLSLALSLGWLLAAGAAYRTYVLSFRAGLKEHTVDAAVPIRLDDMRTIEIVVQSLGSADPRQVLHSLEILEANGRGHLVPPLLLYHDDAEVRRRTLQVLATAGRTDATALVERRLGDDDPDVRAEAIRVLTTFNARDACEVMLPRLKEPDPRVRGAAITCLVNHGDDAMRRQARAALADMLSDAAPERRGEAVKVLGVLRDPEAETLLLTALYDHDPRVVREAVQAVRRMVARDGYNPAMVPSLVALLTNRRVKHDVREALVAFGEAVVPALVHFMNDPGESVAVRRALPKALARLPGRTAVAALLDALETADDALLRAAVVEALALRRDEVRDGGFAPRVEAAIAAEAGVYLRRLGDLRALAGDDAAASGGAATAAAPEARELNLLAQMIAERNDDHLATLFGLLALLYPPRDVGAARRSLAAGRPDLRARALEYLDNTLAGEVRRHVLAVLDDAPIDERLRRAARPYGVEVTSRAATVARFLDGRGDGDADGPALTVAALYTVYSERLAELYPRVGPLAGGGRDPIVCETAAWVARRLGLREGAPCPS